MNRVIQTMAALTVGLTVSWAVLAGSVACAANIWWVDDDNYGKSGMTGAENAAFGTIQEAVNAAVDGDTVYVKPGTYDQGTTDDGFMMSRVVIKDKAIRLESTGDKNDTFIVGRHCTGARPSQHNPDAADNDAIRCIYANCPGTEIRGFTLKDGDVKGDNATALGSGAGLCADGNTSIRLIDCNVVDCWGTRGSGMLNGTAIRCVFAGTRTYSTAGAVGSTCRNSVLYNCIAVSGYYDGTDGFDNCRSVNCTFFGNNGGTLNGTGGYMINCVSVNNTGSASHNPDCDGGNVLDLRYSVFGVNHNELKPKNVNGLEGVVADAPVRQFLAPALGDFRPLAGTAAAANGSAAVLAEYVVTGDLKNCIPAEERFLDINKHPIPTEGRIAAGACQEVVEKPNCGALTFNVSPQVTSAWGVIKVFGTKVIVSGFYAYPETYPAQLHLPRSMFCDVANGIEQLYAYRLGYNQWANFRPPEMDESFWAMPDPNPENDLHISGVWASGAFWVDPTNGDDADNDGSAERPFKSLKKAIAEVPEGAAGNRWVIYAAEGTYDAANEGDAVVAADHNNRVAVTSDLKWIRFKGAGRGKSVIRGAVHAGGQYGGCGSDAARCFYAKSFCVLQGFALQDGFAGWDGATADKSLSKGGSAYLSATASIVADCLIKNCAAERGGGGINGCWYRCKFEDCYGHNGGMRTVSVWSSCSFVNCPATNLGGFLYTSDTSVIGVCHCSVYSSTDYSAFGGGGATWNCVALNGTDFGYYTTTSAGIQYVMDGNIACNFSGAITATGRVSREDPLFASPTDLRPLAGSAVFTAGARPDSPALGTTYSRYVTTDVDGRPLRFNDKGVPVVGCYQIDGLNGVRVETPASGTITPSGTRVLEPGASVTVTYTAVADRPFRGLEVNGELLTGETTYTFMAPAVGEAPKSAVVKASGTSDWYVNANAATDDGDGFTPATAKKRLCDIMACNLQSGDVVHAAPGDYNEGDSCNYISGGSGNTRNRVEVPAGVTLVADEGPDVTFIRGKQGTDPQSIGFGGTGATRCAIVRSGGVLQGFTLVDGYTWSDGNSNLAKGTDNQGGGVYAEDSLSIICNCVITNCYAVRGGGVINGTFYNCRIVRNASIGSSLGSAGVNSSLVGCYIGPQINDGGAFRSPVRFEFCTLDGACLSYGVGSLQMKNCVFRNMTSGLTSSTGAKFDNCIFDTASWNLQKATAGYTGTYADNCKHFDDLKLGTDGIPLAGSPVIDVGVNGSLPGALEGVDAALGQRIYGGTVDVGAFEYDVRADLAAALGENVTVVRVGKGTKVENGKVKLADGETIVGTWDNPGEGKMIYSVTAEAADTTTYLYGSLVADAGIREDFDIVGGTETRTFRETVDAFDFAFGAVGRAGYLSAFTQTPPPGMMLFIR